MASNKFAKNGGAAKRTAEKVRGKSSVAANLPTIMIIEEANLIDCPFNEEDVSNTADLEISMQERGFEDPILVTDFELPGLNVAAGRWMIISGHRRRATARKIGIKQIPCIVRHYNNEMEVRNAVLMANSQRDSARDPMLICKRAWMHAKYLQDANYDGSIREEVARRLAISSQQADRYLAFQKIVPSAQELVEQGDTSISALQMLASHTEEEQAEIVSMLKEALDNKLTLTRDRCDSIVKLYRSGTKSIAPVGNAEDVKAPQRQAPLSPFINPEDPIRNDDDTAPNPLRPSEVRREGYYDDKADTDPLKEERLTEDDYKVIEDEQRRREREEEIPLPIKAAAEYQKHIERLEKTLNKDREFPSKNDAERAIRTASTVTTMIIEDIAEQAKKYGSKEAFREAMKEITIAVERFSKED